MTPEQRIRFDALLDIVRGPEMVEYLEFPEELLLAADAELKALRAQVASLQESTQGALDAANRYSERLEQYRAQVAALEADKAKMYDALKGAQPLLKHRIAKLDDDGYEACFETCALCRVQTAIDAARGK